MGYQKLKYFKMNYLNMNDKINIQEILKKHKVYLDCLGMAAERKLQVAIKEIVETVINKCKDKANITYTEEKT